MGQLLLVMIALPAATALPVSLLGRWPAAVRWLTLAASLATLALALVVVAEFKPREDNSGPSPLAQRVIQPQMELPPVHWFSIPYQHGDTPKVAHIEFRLGIDGISLWLVALTALLMVSSVLASWRSIDERVAAFHALLLLLATGMLGVFCAFDLILFYVFFEFTLIPLFFLIGIWGGPERRYAARKFFLYTLAGSLLTLVALVALVLTLFAKNDGELNFAIPRIAADMANQMGLAQGNAELAAYWRHWQGLIFLGLFAGFAIKVPLVPFHTWLPLAHTEAPTAGSVLLAGILLKLGTYGFLRIALPILPMATLEVGVPLITTLAVIGIIYGAMCALAQSDIKKLVAYSSVSHLGFCMLGMFALNAEGMTGSVYQMVNHGLSTGGLFLLVGMLYERYHTRQLSEIGGLAGRVPLLTAMMVFMCLSSMGLPGLNGFVGELLCLIGMFKADPMLAAAGATGIVLGAWYLMTMLQRGFFGPLKEPRNIHPPITDLQPREWAALLPIAAACVLIGVYPKPFTDVIKPEVMAIEKLYAQPSWKRTGP